MPFSVLATMMDLLHVLLSQQLKASQSHPQNNLDLEELIKMAKGSVKEVPALQLGGQNSQFIETGIDKTEIALLPVENCSMKIPDPSINNGLLQSGQDEAGFDDHEKGNISVEEQEGLLLPHNIMSFKGLDQIMSWMSLDSKSQEGAEDLNMKLNSSDESMKSAFSRHEESFVNGPASFQFCTKPRDDKKNVPPQTLSAELAFVNGTAGQTPFSS